MQTEPDIGEGKIKNKKYNFETIGKKMLKEIDGEYIKEKYNINPGKEFGQKLHQERIIWMKNEVRSMGTGFFDRCFSKWVTQVKITPSPLTASPQTTIYLILF